MERKPTRFELRLPPELGDHIDEWRRSVPALPPRAEAARRLIEFGLKAYNLTQAKPGGDYDRALAELMTTLRSVRNERAAEA